MATPSSILAWKVPWTEGYSPWGHKELDTTEQMNTHTAHMLLYVSGRDKQEIRGKYILMHLTQALNVFHLFIVGCAGSLLLHGLSLVVVSRAYSLVRHMCFFLCWLFMLQSTGSRCVAFNGCMRGAGQSQCTASRVRAQ